MIDLQKAILSLSEHSVEYVIVGGVAITLHSTGYITQDLDFCYRRTKENISRLASALVPFKPIPRDWDKTLPYIFDATTLWNETNFTFETSIGAIDLLGKVKGIGDYTEALKNSISYSIYGCEISAFTLDALIISKSAADRPKDHLVLPELKALREALDPTKE